MTADNDLEIFLVTAPGLEQHLAEELTENGFKPFDIIPGGVTIKGDWREAWRANLVIRGASRVLVRIASFRAHHLAQLDKRAHKVAWSDILRPGLSVKVEASCKSSRIYHEKAAAQRIATAIENVTGATISKEADITVKARIVKDLCTISLDTSGELLHKRGHKAVVNKAPMRESLASLMLRHCGYSGKEAVLDPMSGSGTFVIEAAEMAKGLYPGRSRSFAFEQFANFDEAIWTALKETNTENQMKPLFYGFDRDAGAVKMSEENAQRAGVDTITRFEQQTIGRLTAPDVEPGLVIINPPYGGRIGKKKKLDPLYQSLGHVLSSNFAGWRIGLVTDSETLAHKTSLPFNSKSAPISHGGIRVKIYQTDPLVKGKD